MAQHVFLSYSSHDKAVADTVCAALEAGGIPCWMAPRNILPGSDYGASIIEALEGAQAIVLVFSSHSNVSPHIKREIERAVNKSIAIIPFRIENVTPSKSLEYFISTQHWLDAFTPPLEQHLKHLVETMRVLLGRVGSPPPGLSGPPPAQATITPVAPVAAFPPPTTATTASPEATQPVSRTIRTMASVPIMVGVILVCAVAIGLFMGKSRQPAAPKPPSPPAAPAPQAKAPEPKPAVAYNLERARTAIRPEEKIQWLTMALELEPSLAEAYNDRGIIYAQQGQLDQALKDLTAAISRHPSYAKAYNNRGNVHQKQGNLDKALEDYNKALALKADYSPAYVNRGNVLQQKGQSDQALADYEKAIALKPKDATAYLNRGLLLLARQDYDRALADLNQAITLEPHNALAYRHRGQAHLKKGNHDLAQSDFQRAQSLASPAAK